MAISEAKRSAEKERDSLIYKLQQVEEQNTFMYDVFLSTLLTPIGQFHIRNHELNRDAKKVWENYCGYMQTSTREDIKI